MAKTLAQGRKPGSGRKPGKAKTLAQGRKPGSGRKKRQQQQQQQNNIINTIDHADSNNNNTLTLSQNHLNVNSISLQSNDLPTNNANHNNKTDDSGTNNNLHEKLDSNANNLSTRDMVAADALRELTQSPLSLTSSNANNQSNYNNNNNPISSTMSNPAITDNLMLPPLNEIISYTDSMNPTDAHSHHNDGNSTLQYINSNDSIASPLNHSEVSAISFTNKLNNNNDDNNSSHTSASISAEKNFA